ncbi:MAG TPA: META domain-containing protein [Sphingomicrobium sp.]|nr:META domain-containing protein [Sphingomicrobium sp.]
MKQLLALPLTALVAACMAYPPPPPITPGPPGGAYRAVGTEPFWELTIDPARMIFTDRGNNVQVTQPTPPVTVGFAGEIYRTPRIALTIVHQPCSDGMNDRTYRDRVQVTVDGRLLNGCGGEPISPATLANTNWRVVAVNGRSTPQSGDYSMTFQSDRMAAKFGCNTMGGLYRQTGTTLIVSDLSQTLIGCPEPSAGFERDGALVLSQQMRLTWAGGDRLRLSGGPGRTIDLARSY